MINKGVLRLKNHNSYVVTALLLVTTITLSTGCANTQNPNEIGGMVLGTLAGGAIGSTMGSGRGKTATTVIGALGGAFLGSHIGKKLDRIDQQNIHHALNQQTGNSQWQNSNNGKVYTMTTAQARFDDGQPCRYYKIKAAYPNGQPEMIYGKACRVNGVWIQQ
jgi:surface antigen